MPLTKNSDLEADAINVKKKYISMTFVKKNIFFHNLILISFLLCIILSKNKEL